jgi:hypothetical protein
VGTHVFSPEGTGKGGRATRSSVGPKGFGRVSLVVLVECSEESQERFMLSGETFRVLVGLTWSREL